MGAARRARVPVRVLVPYSLTRGLFRYWLSALVDDRDSRRAMERTLDLHDLAYRAADRAAIAYDDGVHVKHRLTRYHDFFVERVRPGERVLDIGCGKGELACDLAERAGATVVGVDFDPGHLGFAIERSAHPGVTYVAGDVLEGLPPGPFDVVVLSNVLEHFERRVELLRRVVEEIRPRAVLVRVPMYARHWMVPLKEELGLAHFSDPTHWIEYSEQAFVEELGAAGLEVAELLLTWGEIWAVGLPRSTSSA